VLCPGLGREGVKEGWKLEHCLETGMKERREETFSEDRLSMRDTRNEDT
jgi:hypothetical protein